MRTLNNEPYKMHVIQRRHELKIMDVPTPSELLEDLKRLDAGEPIKYSLKQLRQAFPDIINNYLKQSKEEIRIKKELYALKNWEKVKEWNRKYHREYYRRHKERAGQMP